MGRREVEIMAVIHKSHNELSAKMRKRKVQHLLCMVGCVAAGVVPLLILLNFHRELWDAMDRWEGAYLTLLGIREAAKTGPGAVVDLFARGVGKVIRLLPWLLPCLAGAALYVAARMYLGPAGKEYAILRSGVEGEKHALMLAKQLPASCHVFVNRHIAFAGGRSETDLIIAGPGGVAVVEVKNYVGQITGDVNDRELTRTKRGQAPEPLANPARQVATHVQRLGRYLRAEGLNVWAVPCVAFVNPLVDVQITGGKAQLVSGQAGTVIATAQDFGNRIGVPLATGGAYDEATLQRIVNAILRAPEQ